MTSFLQPSQKNWFAATSNAMGMVSYATVIVMLHNDNWKLDLSPKTWVRWMAYLDAVAFTITFVKAAENSNISPAGTPCGVNTAWWFAADCVFSFKDAFKYGYITFKACTITGVSVKWPAYATFATSLLLYWLFMFAAYSFTDPCTGNMPTVYVQTALYSFWGIVDLGATGAIVRKFLRVTRDLKGATTYQQTT
ncbi:hypothetical protein HDU78_007123 [Chytriomyces hyalinus]|nr:hypothetical protein HDU78_007123 [Chytriomyces hyalinus]KAJ3253333.1 hypothetical protein HDU77_004635 [Chytriomyces hyalinus]